MQFAWLILSLLTLSAWLIIYFLLRTSHSRREMFVVSVWTSLLGLTEPLFVPEYWNPPSLFDLAKRTGFDIESLIFSFAIGGIAVVAYETLFKGRHTAMSEAEHRHKRHRFHIASVLSAPLVFIALLIFTDFNPIYAAILALTSGFFATWYCRSDLIIKMLASGLIFTAIYFLAFSMLNQLFPGYMEAVWQLSELSGVIIARVPLEELLWAFTFGLYWSSVYEHVYWQKLVPERR